MRNPGGRRKKTADIVFRLFQVALATIFITSAFFFITLHRRGTKLETAEILQEDNLPTNTVTPENHSEEIRPASSAASCATVEEMGEKFAAGSGKESLRVRRMIQDHFALNGAERVRRLPPEEFCRQGFVLGKASEAGFGNEMYKILTASALSLLLDRSLIIGQTRGKYPFGDYIRYTNLSFTLHEVKHLWRKNKCLVKHGKNLVIRVDNFEKPDETDVLCSDWRSWREPIIWFQNTTDAVAAQFFLKNVHSGMRNVALSVFGLPESLEVRPNVFGELMRLVISPSQAIEEAVTWALDGHDPHISLHMRMLTKRSVRSIQSSLSCIRKAVQRYQDHFVEPRVVIVSDTPSVSEDIKSTLSEFAEVVHFDYNLFERNTSRAMSAESQQSLGFRRRDWGPLPRWVLFVDFFLAARAKHAVVTGAHKRVGTTFAQLLAAFASARQLDDDDDSKSPPFSFLSSIHSNLLVNGLSTQVGWGHIWNRFAGPLSCHNQPNQCAFTPILAPAWWDAPWQSPLARDVRRLRQYGVHLTDSGKVDEGRLLSFCRSKKKKVHTIPLL